MAVKVPNGRKQKHMRQRLIGMLDEQINDWSPAFVTEESNRESADNLLNTLSLARNWLSNMHTVQTDTRVTGLYETIFENIKNVKTYKHRYSGEAELINSVSQLWQAVQAWSVLV